MGEVSLTTTEFRALSSESRTGILKMLAERNYTLSELSAKTGMAAPTVKQHASILVESGLIELRDEGRKWKYYALTRKGKEILNAGKPQQTNVLIILSTTAMVAALGLALLSSNLGIYSTASAPQGIDARGSAPIQPAPTQENKELAAPLGLGTRESPSGTAADANQPRNCVPSFPMDYTAQPDEMVPVQEWYAQKCHEASSRAECEKLDIYSGRTHAFGEQDGKVDCQWHEKP